MPAQFASRQDWLTCDECDGRSFSDPAKPFHYPECSQYMAWRFGSPAPKPVPHIVYEEDAWWGDPVLEDYYREAIPGEEI